MRDILKSWTKKEKLGTLVGIVILLLGIMMKISKTPLTVGNGIVSKSVYMITDTIFAGNVTVISLIIAMCFCSGYYIASAICPKSYRNVEYTIL